MRRRHKKRRIPKLLYSDKRGLGYHVNYREAKTGLPRKHRFGMVSRDEALESYNKWLAAHLQGETPEAPKRINRKLVEQIGNPPRSAPIKADIANGSLLHICSGYLTYEESRVRNDDAERRQNTIKRKQYESKELIAQEFMQFLNSRHGDGAVMSMQLADLTLGDVEAYNQTLTTTGDFSESQVKKRMQVVKQLIDRAGRPEHGGQVLTWNWAARDIAHGRPDQVTTLPSLNQLKLILKKCNRQRTAMIWLAIGCGFGQRDLAAIRVGQIDSVSYDLRRGKTGIDRYGDTPKLVWKCIEGYLADTPRRKGELLFLTEQGMPLVHGKTDSVGLWWAALRTSLGDDADGLDGFYSLRHLGATEFGSRPGCSISGMRRWLGHSTSSQVADRYMKPVSPEYRAAVEWVRKSLKAGKADLRLPAKRRGKIKACNLRARVTPT